MQHLLVNIKTAPYEIVKQQLSQQQLAQQQLVQYERVGHSALSITTSNSAISK